MQSDENLTHLPTKFTRAQVDLMNHFRLLWEQHDVWTRATTSSLVFQLPDIDPVIARLLRNPVDFEQALQPFYGRRIAARFQELLREHLVLAAELIIASRDGDETAAEEAERLWYINAEEIAAFLDSINPFWSRKQWRMLLFHHLDLVLAQAAFMLTGQYEAGVAVYDEIELQSLVMADVMSQGIIAQFNVR